MRVTTFNVLHDGVRNRLPAWPRRRPLVAGLIRSLDPDVAALQEVSPRQLVDLERDLPEYTVLAGEPSGATQLPSWISALAAPARQWLGDFFTEGERCPILVRNGTVTLVESGSWHLRLSPTPHVVHWARVEVAGRFCMICNTHLGSWAARATAAALAAWLDDAWRGEPQILMGDFNARPRAAFWRELARRTRPELPGFLDAWAVARRRDDGGSTFHWGKGWPGPRLDYILFRPGPAAALAATASGRAGRAYPSDHRALTVDFDPDPKMAA